MKSTGAPAATTTTTKQSRIDWRVLAEFFCRHHGVSDPRFIVPFGAHPVYAWEMMRESVLSVQSSAKDMVFNIRTEDHESQAVNCPIQPMGDPQPRDRFIHPNKGTPMDADLEEACIYTIACRHYKCTTPISLAVRLNYYHPSMAKLQQTREHDEMYEAAGAVRGAFTVLRATGEDGSDMGDVPLPKLHFAYQNDFFCRTMALVDDSNIMNGIVTIPREVCIASRLPVYQGIPEPDADDIAKLMRSMKIDVTTPEGEGQRADYVKQYKDGLEDQFKDAKLNQFFYAIPINHVLAWGLSSEEYASQHGFRTEMFRYTPPNGQESVVLYFMMGSADFDALLVGVRKDWMGKVDKRPIRDVAFQVLPILKPQYDGVPAEVERVTCSVSMRSIFTYCAAPRVTPATLAGLAPALCPGFPACHEWSVDEIAKQIAIEQHMLKSGGGGGGGSRK